MILTIQFGQMEDTIYGEIKVESPVILKLINTRAFLRLKKINQYGGVNFIFKDRFQVSRYEHSIGVWHVLYSLGCNLETQVAGLLHDIGHTAFSHMVDGAMAIKTEDYHEKIAHKYLDDLDEVNSILKELNISLKNVDDYSEIKKSLPDVGADRLDYAIRDYVASTGEKSGFGKTVLDNIILMGRNIIFKNTDIAKEFALTGLEAMWNVIYEPNVAVVYQSLIEIIRDGLTEGWLTDKELCSDDETVFKIFRANKYRFDSKYFDIFEKPYRVIQGDLRDHDFKHIKLKARYFDPMVLVDNQTKRVSDLDDDFRNKLEEWKELFENRKDGAYYKIVL